jgi:hypothetical protein
MGAPPPPPLPLLGLLGLIPQFTIFVQSATIKSKQISITKNTYLKTNAK